MAGNKPTRKPAKTNNNVKVTVKPNRLLQAIRSAVAPQVEYMDDGGAAQAHLYNKTLTLAQLHVAALTSINTIIEGNGNFKDWMNVVYRLYIGSVAYENYFKADDDVVAAFNRAHIAAHIMMVRTHVTAELRVGVLELDSLTLALSITDQACRNMTVEEIRKVYDQVDSYFNDLPGHNRLRYQEDLQKRLDMMDILIAEYEQVKNIPVSNDIETVEFREAA